MANKRAYGVKKTKHRWLIHAFYASVRLFPSNNESLTIKRWYFKCIIRAHYYTYSPFASFLYHGSILLYSLTTFTWITLLQGLNALLFARIGAVQSDDIITALQNFKNEYRKSPMWRKSINCRIRCMASSEPRRWDPLLSLKLLARRTFVEKIMFSESNDFWSHRSILH